MTTVVVADRLPEGSLDEVRAAGHVVTQLDGGEGLADAVVDADGLICLLTQRIDRPLLAAGASGRLRVVANVAAGYDNVDLAAADELGVAVTNTPGVLEETTADLAFALALMARRATGPAERALRSGSWTGWRMDGFLGHEIHGATLGIVGWGRIGRALARRGAAFGMEVLHAARRPTGHVGQVPLPTLLDRSDVVSLHVPLTDDTFHLIGRAQLDAMKPTAVLVNTSRGPVVDEAALADALRAGSIFGAGLDVFEHEPDVRPELLGAPNAVLLPHIGSATVATRTAMARSAAASVVAVLAGHHPTTVVNHPGRQTT